MVLYRQAASASSFIYLTTDHLGTPVAATTDTGGLAWQGGFEPFGADWSGAGGAGVFLRFPGQWEDGVWAGGMIQSGLYYNLNRLYGYSLGRYSQPDPIGLAGGGAFYGYADQSPILATDILGLLSVKACGVRFIGIRGGLNHVPIVGGYLDKIFGNNLLGYCAKCPVNQSPTNGYLNPTPPSVSGTPDLTLLSPGIKDPGVEDVKNKCGGCQGAGEQFFAANVKTRLALTPGALDQVKDRYSLGYECRACKKP